VSKIRVYSLMALIGLSCIRAQADLKATSTAPTTVVSANDYNSFLVVERQYLDTYSQSPEAKHLAFSRLQDEMTSLTKTYGPGIFKIKVKDMTEAWFDQNYSSAGLGPATVANSSNDNHNPKDLGWLWDNDSLPPRTLYLDPDHVMPAPHIVYPPGPNGVTLVGQ
jgi:hypothetical protein